jgi:TRAP-type uncharacterized transport system substrate-binding protein
MTGRITRLGTLLGAAAWVASAGAAGAQSLDSLLAKDRLDASVKVACGNLDKANCKLLPRLAAQSEAQGVRVEALESRGTTQSAVGVCKGAVDAAIGQRDGFDAVRADPTQGCANALHVVGQPLYPYLGYLVALASSPADSLEELVEGAAEGKFVPIAAGRVGSGGQVTLGHIVDNNPELKRVVQIEPFDQSVALDKLRGGELAAYFVMDGPNSELVNELRTAVDGRNRKLFKFLEIGLPSRFYRDTKDSTGRPMFYSMEVDIAGWMNDIDTIATDAVMVVGTKYAEANPKVVRAMVQALDRSQAAVRADLAVPADWQPK